MDEAHEITLERKRRGLEEAAKLPDSKIHLNKQGEVWKVEGWCLWNDTPWQTTCIERRGHKFSGEIGDPEHGPTGGGIGTLEQACKGLNEKFVKQYQQLFALKNPTQAQVAEIGFERYKIVRSE